MRVTSKGQVTIPQPVREKLGITAGTNVVFELTAEGASLRVARTDAEEIVARMMGTGEGDLTTDEILAFTRG